jgi:multiple sugar transport system permease protein
MWNGSMGVKRRKQIRNILFLIILILLSLIFAMPFLFMLSSAFKTPQQNAAYPPTWIPDPFTLRAFREGFEAFNFSRSFFNSAVITALSIAGNLLSTTLVAYGLSRLRARLSSFLSMVMFSTMLVPWIVTFIPLYIMYARIGFLDTYIPLIMPYFLSCNVFSVFLMRSFFNGIPKDLDEAAKIDGCSTFAILYRIILPNTKAVLLIVSLFVFINTWNDFFAPLIYLSDPDSYTLAVGLAIWNNSVSTNFVSRVGDPSPLMAMSLLTVIPIMILYAVAQKYFIEGVVTSGLKG